MSYYMPSPRPSLSHHGQQPVVYPSSGNGYLSPEYDNGFGGGYGGGQPYIVSTPSSRSRRHHSSSYVSIERSWLSCDRKLTSLSNQHDSHRSRSRHGGHGHSSSHSHSHSHSHRSHRRRSLGQRILGWFGLGRHRSHRKQSKGWSFFGNNNRHRARYMDARTGVETDRYGRPVYKV